jgi:NAD(P)H-quinone oxidoreductase subunit 5
LALGFAATVSLLAWLIFHFAHRYLAHDTAQPGFYFWGHLTVAAVLLMTFADHLLVFWLFWLITSLTLHKLLSLYPSHSASTFAARKKFLISRLGDLCLVAAGGLLFFHTGTLELSKLAALDLAGTGTQQTALSWVGALLVAGAMTKSAQVPFQSWLPETLAVPTPVSALMHAGLINAGGYLILRTYDVIAITPWIAEAMCLMGTLSVAIAGLTMLTTPDVKRQLAHSTTAQMGFMFVQLGLGLPGAAFLHMLGHAFFKAHAFLNSGQLAANPPKATATSSLLIGTTAVTWLLSLVPIGVYISAPDTLTLPRAVSLSILMLATLEGLRLLYPANRYLWRSSLVGLVVLAAGLGWVVSAGPYTLGLLDFSSYEPLSTGPSSWVAWLTLASFGLLYGLQNLLPQLTLTPRTAAIYALLRNGFYFEALTRRIVDHR